MALRQILNRPARRPLLWRVPIGWHWLIGAAMANRLMVANAATFFVCLRFRHEELWASAFGWPVRTSAHAHAIVNGRLGQFAQELFGGGFVAASLIAREGTKQAHVWPISLRVSCAAFSIATSSRLLSP